MSLCISFIAVKENAIQRDIETHDLNSGNRLASIMPSIDGIIARLSLLIVVV